MVRYDTIGNGYNATRKADPWLTGRLYQLLEPGQSGQYLDIGCGTGNYLQALAQRGLDITGVEPSEIMLEEARKKDPPLTLLKGNAEAIPLNNDHFDGAIAVLTFHHWQHKEQGLQELNRVIKPGGRLLFFSFTPAQMRGYWLYHYFPQMIEKGAAEIPDTDAMRQMLANSGFTAITTEKYLVRDDLQDHFMYAHKAKPEQYLDPVVRAGASAFRLAPDADEIEKGLERLAQDIASGAIHHIMRRYDNDLGDYLFIRAVNI